MITIADQLKGLASSVPVRKEKKPVRHGLLGHEIDALVLENVEKWPGTVTERIHMDVAHHALTIVSVDESLRRLGKAGKVIAAQRSRTEKSHYWPIALSYIAQSWETDREARARQVLEEHGPCNTAMVAEYLRITQHSARRALLRMSGVEHYEEKTGLRGRGRWMWRIVK